jgi:hypothetical protein
MGILMQHPVQALPALYHLTPQAQTDAETPQQAMHGYKLLEYESTL